MTPNGPNIPLVDLSAQYQSMKDELDSAVAAVIGANAFIGTSGNRFVRAFEEEFAAYTGKNWCIACGNGTDALEILLKAAGVGPGAEVLVPALSWIATAEAVSTCGATPVFVDILPGLYSMDPDAAARKVTSRTKAIIPVHLYGLPARMHEICRLAERHGLFVLEDCAQAHGATLDGRQVGTFGHVASYSFYPSKNLGAWGDAGAMLTDDPALARTIRMIAQHGQAEHKHDHRIEGRNSRMDGLQAAILSAKLKHLPDWTRARRVLAARYRTALAGSVDSVQACPPGMENVYHLFTVEVRHRDEVQRTLAAQGIATAVQYPVPLPLLEAYARFNHRPEDFPVASAATARILSLPLYPEMTEIQQHEVVAALSIAVAHTRRDLAQA
jgi:dTDP-4-amino-4,6-dideoxygalactose transaminase